MPFCNQCGTEVRPVDAFCGQCGTRQPGASGTGGSGTMFSGLNARTASILCYIPVLGWIPSVFVLGLSQFRNDPQTRFHAFQGLYLFVAWLLADWVIGPMVAFSGLKGGGEFTIGVGAIGGLLKALLLGVWIFMIIKTSQGEHYRLPIIGELAEKSV